MKKDGEEGDHITASQRNYTTVLHELAHQKHYIPGLGRHATWEMMIKIILEAAAKGDKRAVSYSTHLQKIARAPVESRDGGWVAVDKLQGWAEEELWLDLKFRYGQEPVEKYREFRVAGCSRRDSLNRVAKHFRVLHALRDE